MSIFEKLPQLDRFCFCVNLRTGGYILGTIQIISSILILGVGLGLIEVIDKTDEGK